MILAPASYVPSHRRAYGHLPEEQREGKTTKKAAERERNSLKKHKKALSQAITKVEECVWASQAQEYAHRIAAFIGLPTADDLHAFLDQGSCLSDPGELVSISEILKVIMAERRAGWQLE